jgi:hypothetical protein
MPANRATLPPVAAPVRGPAAVTAFEADLKALSCPAAEAQVAMQVTQWAQANGLTPIYQPTKRKLSLRWPRSHREVGAIFSLWAKERELLFDEKWLLREQRFKGTSLGRTFIQRMEQSSLPWGNARPTSDGDCFPSLPLVGLLDPQVLADTLSEIDWIRTNL